MRVGAQQSPRAEQNRGTLLCQAGCARLPLPASTACTDSAAHCLSLGGMAGTLTGLIMTNIALGKQSKVSK